MYLASSWRDEMMTRAALKNAVVEDSFSHPQRRLITNDHKRTHVHSLFNACIVLGVLFKREPHAFFLVLFFKRELHQAFVLLDTCAVFGVLLKRYPHAFFFVLHALLLK